MSSLRRRIRSLLRSPWFFTTAVGSVALGIGACTAVFSLINGVFFRPLPFPAPRELVEVYATVSPDSEQPSDMLAGDRVRLWPEVEFRTLEAMAVASEQEFQLTSSEDGADVTATVPGAAVSGRWFDVLGLSSERGRVLGPDDDRPGAPETVVVSHAVWSDLFGSRPSALGSLVRLSGRSYTLVGVMPRSFERGRRVWVARSALARTPSGGQVLARLREDASLGQARLEVQRLAAGEVAADSARYGGLGATLVPMGQLAQRRARTGTWLVLAAVLAVFLLALSNLTSLFLVRAADRSHPMAIRAVLGGNRWQLGSDLLYEIATIGVLGTAAGLVLARWGQDIVARSTGLGVSGGMPILDVRVVGFAVGLAMMTFGVVGLEPVRRLYLLRIQDALKRSGPAVTLGRGERRARAAMLGVQVAVALFLVAASTTIAMAVRAYRAIDVGYDADQVVVAEADYLSAGIGHDEQRTVTWELQRAVAREPSIVSATRWQLYSIGYPPRSEDQLVLDRATDAATGPSPRDLLYRVYAVGDDFFATLRIPILQGRPFGSADGPGDPPVAVITADAAAAWWPGEDALGRRFRLGESGPWVTVAGICANTSELWNLGRFWTLIPRARRIQVYLPFAQMPAPPSGWGFGRGATFDQNVVVAARSSEGTDGAAWILDAIVRGRVPAVRVVGIRSLLDDQMRAFGGADLLLSRKIATASAIVAILLALLGVAGVVGDSVTSRTREIGIRMALGARAHQILAHVSREGLGVAGAGGAVGLMVYWFVGTGLDGSVFPGSLSSLGVDPMDWRLMAGALGVVLSVVVATSLAVARRATRIEPTVALTAD